MTLYECAETHIQTIYPFCHKSTKKVWSLLESAGHFLFEFHKEKGHNVIRSPEKSHSSLSCSLLYRQEPNNRQVRFPLQMGRNAHINDFSDFVTNQRRRFTVCLSPRGISCSFTRKRKGGASGHLRSHTQQLLCHAHCCTVPATAE